MRFFRATHKMMLTQIDDGSMGTVQATISSKTCGYEDKPGYGIVSRAFGSTIPAPILSQKQIEYVLEKTGFGELAVSLSDGKDQLRQYLGDLMDALVDRLNGSQTVIDLADIVEAAAIKMSKGA